METGSGSRDDADEPVFAEYLTLKPSDEAKIFDAINKAAKKQCQGAVFSLKVRFDSSKTLKAGVKDIGSNILVVSMLKRVDGQVGPAEAAGLRLGDIVFGANFSPLRDGCRSMMSVLEKQLRKNRRSIHLQCWRCAQLCPDPVPGLTFPRMNDALVRSYFLLKSCIFDDWERWNFLEIQLGYMLDDLKLRDLISSSTTQVDKARLERQLRRKHTQMSDTERNITQAKGLRAALCVRIVHTKNVEDTVAYVMRIEDVETGLQWVVHRRYRDFHALHKELSEITTVTQDVRFPSSRLSFGRRSERVVEGRLVSLEWWTRAILSLFSNYARMDPAVSRALRLVQAFLGVDRYIDCIRPPPMDDQRYVELIIFRVLENEASLLHDRCEQFVTTVKLQNFLNPKDPYGYVPMLKHIQDALEEVQEYVLDSFQGQLVSTLHKRNKDMSSEEIIIFVRRCIRRQVEASIYLPLRRNVIKLAFPYLSEQTAKLQRAMTVLRGASPTLFLAHPMVRQAKSYEAARKMFRDISRAYLPADQGQLLIRAAGTVLAVYSECRAMSRPNDGSSSKAKPVVVARPDLLKSLIEPVLPDGESGATVTSSTSTKRSVSVPQAAESKVVTSSVMRTQSLADTNYMATPKKAIFVVPRQPPERSATHAHSSSIDIDFKNESVVSDPVAALFPALDTEENLDAKFTRLADGARIIDLPESALPSSLHSPDSKVHSKQHSDSNFNNTESSETFNRLPSNSGSISPIAGNTNRDSVPSSHPEIPIPNPNPPIPARLAQLQGSESEDKDDTPTRGLKSILSDLSVRFNSVRIQTGMVDENGTNTDNYGIENNVDENDDDDGGSGDGDSGGEGNNDRQDDTGVECDNINTNEANESFSDTWKNTICVTPGLPSPKSNVVSPEGTVGSATEESTRLVGEINSKVSQPTPKKAQSTQAQSQARAVSRASTDSVKARAHLFAIDSPRSPPESSGPKSGHKLSAMGADDFLPLFAYILTQSELPELLLVKELLMHLVDSEEAHGECGYYSATLEAATQLIIEVAEDFTASDVAS